ncbi:MAG TPA: hypothetical protein VLM89_13785 [Phycisphaerae bacterium]|nr:hypothetical protein [Phycisphaerae bacterium]
MERMLKFASIGLSLGGLVCSLCVLGAGCSKPTERLNSPPQGHTDYPNQLQEPFVYMTDNAMLADMSMSSAHFVPHQTELNSLGMRRLKRFAQILKLYGGTLRYDGVTDQEKLAADRIGQIKQVLIAEGVESDRCKVERGLAGGEGMNAKEAILIREATSFQPEQAQQQAPPGMSMMSGQGAMSATPK